MADASKQKNGFFLICWRARQFSFFTHYAVVKARVAFFSGVDVSDTCDGAKTSKCHGLRPLYRGIKVPISKMKCRPSQKKNTKEPKNETATNIYRLTQLNTSRTQGRARPARSPNLPLPTQSGANQRVLDKPSKVLSVGLMPC